MSDSYSAVIETPLPGGARLGVRCTAGAVTEIDILAPGTPLCAAKEPLARQAEELLRRYFRDGCVAFEPLPLAVCGTPFQRRVWSALQAIPPGRVTTYGELGRQLASGARAVAGACRANPIPIIVPCHRVVAVSGLGGYMGALGGDPLAIKQWLITHEARCSR